MTSLDEQREANRGARHVAVIALLAALGGGIVTSTFTYLGVAQQFANQRTAQIDDTRRGAYIEYLRLVQSAYNAPAGADEQQLRISEAVVQLLAGAEVRAVMTDLTESALEGSETYTDLRAKFIEAAQREREAAAQVDYIPFF